MQDFCIFVSFQNIPNIKVGYQLYLEIIYFETELQRRFFKDFWGRLCKESIAGRKPETSLPKLIGYTTPCKSLLQLCFETFSMSISFWLYKRVQETFYLMIRVVDWIFRIRSVNLMSL